MATIQELKSIENLNDYTLNNFVGSGVFRQVTTIDPTANCWKYNSDNSVEINSIAGVGGMFILRFYNVKQGDIIEGKCEALHMSGDDIRLSVDIFIPNKVVLSYVGTRKRGEYETLTIKITVPQNSSHLDVVAGIWTANAGRGIIRNFRATLTTRRRISKPFRHVNINNRDSGDGSFILTSGRANDPAIVEHVDNSTVRITFEERFQITGSSFTNQEYFGDTPRYIVRTSFAQPNSLLIRFYDITNPLTPVPLANLPRTLFVGVLLVGG